MQPAVEAGFRGVSIGGLIGDLIVATLQAHARERSGPRHYRG
jgi:hypothetical protein